MSVDKNDGTKGVETLDVSTPAGQLEQCTVALKSALAGIGTIAVGGDLKTAHADMEAHSAALDAVLSERPLIKAFLEQRGLTRVSELDEQGLADITAYMKGLWDQHVQPLLDEPAN